VSYIDTSVIVAVLDPSDPRWKRARSILEGEGERVVSELVIAELASVLSRRSDMLSSIADVAGLGVDEAVVAVILYLVKRFGLKYRRAGGFERFPLLGAAYKPMANAVKLASRLKLRTLDLLHVAYAEHLRELGEPIREIVTADYGFKRAEKVLREEMKLELRIL